MLCDSWPEIAEEYESALRRRDREEADILIGSICLYTLEAQGRLLTNEVNTAVCLELGCYVPWAHVVKALRLLADGGFIEAQRNGGGACYIAFSVTEA